MIDKKSYELMEYYTPTNISIEMDKLKKVPGLADRVKYKHLHYFISAYNLLKDNIIGESIGTKYFITAESFRCSWELPKEEIISDLSIFTLEDEIKEIYDLFKSGCLSGLHNKALDFLATVFFSKLNSTFVKTYEMVIKNDLRNEELNGYEIKGKNEDGEEFEVYNAYALFTQADMSDCYRVDHVYLDHKTQSWLPIVFNRGKCGLEDYRYPVTALTQDGKVIGRGYFTDH